MRIFVCLLAAVCLANRASAQPSRDETVKTEFRALMAELNAARAAHDRAALERIYADEFLFVHALGAPVDRKSQIDSAMNAGDGALPVPSFDGLLVYGDVAVLRAPVEARFGTTIYAKKNGRWQIVQMQGTPQPSAKPAADVPVDVLRAYVGRYQQDNGLFVTMTLDGDRLSLQVDGRAKLALGADSSTVFALPAGAGTVTFAKAPDGGVTYEVKRPSGQVVKGTRIQQ